MKLSIKNLGPLTKGGTIDLDKRFFVFVGKNNSGKTYVANVLGRLFENNLLLENDSVDMDCDFRGVVSLELSEKKIKEDITIQIEKALTNKLPIIFNVAKENSIIKDAEFKLSGVYNCFKSKYYNIKHHVNLFDTDTYSVITVEKEEGDTVVKINIENNDDTLNYYQLFIEKKESPIKGNKFKRNLSLHAFNDLIKADILRFFTPWSIVFFLPANRAFFPTFWKYIYKVQKELIDEVYHKKNMGENIDIDSILRPNYSRQESKLIDAIEGLDRDFSENNLNNDLIAVLEKIIGGNIAIIKGVESSLGRMSIQFNLEKDKNIIPLDLYLASSSVNQLTVLYLYFKYWAKPSHNFLIVDEPEENLHPENQIKLLNILAKFADRNNNKVLITTHSTLMTEAVNNYVRMGYLKEKGVDVSELAAGAGLHTLAELEQKDFGVYYFGEGKIKEYEADEFGVFFKDFAKVEDEVRDTANLLKDKIYKLVHPKVK